MTQGLDARAQRTLDAAERVSKILSELGIASAAVGAMALAAHHYVRSTSDFDLGTSVDPFTVLKRVAERLSTEGFDAHLEYPDPEDPLGGVITLASEAFDEIQVVNFFNPWTGGAGNLAKEAIARATAFSSSPSLKVVSLEHVIALKLYAGGAKSLLDVVELLRVNPEADRDAIQATCERFGLGSAFAQVRRSVGEGT